MSRLAYILGCFVLVAVVGGSNKFPSDIERCKHNDSDCIAKVVTGILQTFYAKGHRGLGLIQFDPLFIKSMVFKRIPNSPVSVEFSFKDNNLLGVSQATVLKMTGFTKEASDLTFEMHVKAPKVTLQGPYSIEGQVLVLPISGKGMSTIVMEDLFAIAKAKCVVEEKDGQKYLKIVDAKLHLQPKRVTFDLQNLFNGDKALGDSMNQVLNENWDVVFRELQPLVNEALVKIAVHIANGTFSKIPYSELFLPE